MNSVEDTFLKKYFRAFAKPITLTLLFFIIVISLYFLVYYPDPARFIAGVPGRISAEERAREFARVSDLGSWLSNLFRGNFGISIATRNYISADLYWRAGFTLLLIGISLAASILTGIGSVFLFSFLKRHEFKSLTFAHSLNGYFFGLVLLIGVGILFLFPRAPTILPSPYYHYLHRPDLLRPTLTLVFVTLVRNIVVIGSSGSLFESKNRYKSLLLPITTIDFSFTISAALVTEILFEIGGLGKWFFDSLTLTGADYNVTVAAFIMILVIAVCLGVASIPLDIIKHMSGLHEELERRSVAKSKTNTRSSRRGWRLLKRKTFWIGLTIVISFLLLAALAPWITGGIDPEKRGFADRYAMPEWMALYNPAYQSFPRTTDYSPDWNWSSLPEGVTIQQTDNEWTIQYEGNQSVVVPLYAKFHYLYDPPNNFYYQFKWGAKPEFVDTEATARYSLELNLTTPDGKVYPLWDQHWERYRIARCYLKNLDECPEYYPGLNDYARYGYHVYKRYGWQIPTWETVESNVSIFYRASREACIRLGYAPWSTKEMTHDLFYPSGEFTFMMYVTIQPTQPNAKCEISVTNLKVHVLGVLWGLLGTEHWGRDCWSRLVYGARTMLAVPLAIAALAVLIGFPFGFIAGHFKSWPDNIVMTHVDAVLFIPVLPFIILIIRFVGRQWLFISLITLPFLFTLTTKAFRYKYFTARNQKLKETTKENQFLNLIKSISGNIFLTAASAILLFVTIDFLEFGDPYLPSWGRELNMMQYLGVVPWKAWWWLMPPIMFTALLALGFLLLGVSLEQERD